MIAVVKIAGKQYVAETGKNIKFLSEIESKEQKVILDQVLLIADEKKATLGNPLVKGANIEVEKISEGKDKKVLVVKHHPKKRYRRVRGHRQQYTKILIKKINEK